MAKINWQADLEQLAKELPLLHKNLFFHQKREQFHTSICTLKRQVEAMDIYAIVMEIARIVASLGDAHTSVALPRNNRLPLACYWFEEGLFVTAALPEYGELLHHKMVAIDGIPIHSVINRLTEIVSHENRSFLMAQLPDYLICTDILFGLGIARDVKSITITLEDRANQQRDIIIPTIKYEEWGPAALPEKVGATDKLPLYRKNQDKYYWSEFNPGKKLLYINYNHCKDMPTDTVREFSRQLITTVKNNAAIQKMVIDLRNNGGGNSELFKGFLTWLSTFDRLNRPGCLFVIVGRDTFSSALLNTFYLKLNTHAVFLGEPTGGKPNHYGEVKYLSLDSSGLYIRYSTKYYQFADDDALPSFLPDRTFAVTFEDYSQYIDPCLDWIYSQIKD
jgi:hypothetical protein